MYVRQTIELYVLLLLLLLKIWRVVCQEHAYLTAPLRNAGLQTQVIKKFPRRLKYISRNIPPEIFELTTLLIT